MPFAALAVGDREAVTAALPQFRPSGPIFLVCANGRHDVCCAIHVAGRWRWPGVRYPGRVWECSHTGGHRFSPTGVLLPWGRTLGRLDVSSVGEVLESADLGDLPFGLLGPWHDRGCSAYPPRVQVGESAVRDEVGETDLEALTASASGPLEVKWPTETDASGAWRSRWSRVHPAQLVWRTGGAGPNVDGDRRAGLTFRSGRFPRSVVLWGHDDPARRAPGPHRDRPDGPSRPSNADSSSGVRGLGRSGRQRPRHRPPPPRRQAAQRRARPADRHLRRRAGGPPASSSTRTRCFAHATVEPTDQAWDLLDRLAKVYVSPDDVPGSPSAGYVIRCRVERIAGVGPWVSSAS